MNWWEQILTALGIVRADIVELEKRNREVLRVACERDENIIVRINSDCEMLTNAFNELNKVVGEHNGHLHTIHAAFHGLSRRIDTLEILASKKFVEEIEGPKHSSEKIGNS